MPALPTRHPLQTLVLAEEQDVHSWPISAGTKERLQVTKAKTVSQGSLEQPLEDLEPDPRGE